MDGRRLVLQLVKNPAGFRQSLRTLETAEPKAIMIAINDDYADGRDVSWLWDVDFAALRDRPAPPCRRRAPGRPTWRCGCTTTTSRSPAIEADLEAATRAAVASVRAGRGGDRVLDLHRDVGAARDPAADRGARADRGAGMITLAHLYPREMNIYGDTGNVVVLAKRLAWRGLEARVVPVNVGDPLPRRHRHPARRRRPGRGAG